MIFEATYTRRCEVVECETGLKQTSVSVRLLKVEPLDEEAKSLSREQLLSFARKSIHREI